MQDDTAILTLERNEKLKYVVAATALLIGTVGLGLSLLPLAETFTDALIGTEITVTDGSTISSLGSTAANPSVVGSEAFYKLDKFKTVKDTLIAAATLNSGILGAVTTFTTPWPTADSDEHMALAEVPDVGSLFEMAVDAFAVSAEASNIYAYRTYAKRLDGLREKSLEQAANTAALHFLHRFVEGPGGQDVKRDHDVSDVNYIENEQGFWMALGFDATAAYHSVNHLDSFGQVIKTVDTATITVSDDKTDLEGLSQFSYKLVHEEVIGTGTQDNFANTLQLTMDAA